MCHFDTIRRVLKTFSSLCVTAIIASEMEGVFLEYSDENRLSRYRNLPKVGFDVHITIEGIGKTVSLQGLKLTDKVSSIQNEIFKLEEIHPNNQRLFLAGEVLEKDKTLSECYITKECYLTLKSFIPVLVSSLESPGPMLTEIEVHPKYDESIGNIKVKLSTKLGIDVDIQRLYLAASEMTSFPRRRELDDISNLSRYLSPSSENSFLELRPKLDTNYKTGNIIVFKVPMTVQNTRENGANDDNLTEDELLRGNPDVKLLIIPHERHLNEEPYWLSLELSTDKIIKRDPLVEDIVKLLRENLRPIGRSQNQEITTPIRLKFARKRIVHGGIYLLADMKCSENYQMRAEEQQLNVEIDGHQPPEESKFQEVSLPTPLPPLTSYGEKGTRYTMPRNNVKMIWEIPSEAVESRINPSVEMEISAFSYSRLCGSWDIAEHYKTYVEILLEGTFYTGDNNESQTTTILSQNFMQITILGPENEKVSNFKIINKDPMRWYRKSAEGQRKSDIKPKTLERDLGFSSPFRYDTRPVNMPKPIDIKSEHIDYGREGFSKLVVNNWYIGKEKVSNITIPSPNNRSKTFHASCSRGESLSGNPLVKFTYKNMYPSINREENRRAFDFRVQAQFFVCTLEDNFENKSEMADYKRFTISVRHDLTKTVKRPNLSDIVTDYSSPITGKMETTVSIDLANHSWLNEPSQP